MNSDFAVTFEEVAAFLQSMGITPKVDMADTASQSDLEDFTRSTGVQLPSSFSDFFTTFSNGYSLTWELGEDFGGFSMPNLESLAKMRCEWVLRTNEFADASESMNQCIEPKFRAEAFKIWERMKNWVPFVEELDGDTFCVDLANGAIVFDKHDWFDGFGEVAETNGMIAASSLIDFVKIWGKFSFEPQWFTDVPHPADQTHLEWICVDSEFERK